MRIIPVSLDIRVPR